MRGRLGRFRLDDIDAALEVCAIFNDDAGGADIAHQLGILADLDLLVGFHVALNGAQSDHFPRFYAGADHAVGPDGELVLKRLHCAFHFAIDIKIFPAVDLADDFDGLSDTGGAGGLCGSNFPMGMLDTGVISFLAVLWDLAQLERDWEAEE